MFLKRNHFHFQNELWWLPNVLISSHNADWIESYFEDSMDIFV